FRSGRRSRRESGLSARARDRVRDASRAGTGARADRANQAAMAMAGSGEVFGARRDAPGAGQDARATGTARRARETAPADRRRSGQHDVKSEHAGPACLPTRKYLKSKEPEND